ncbi:MAG: SsrA-binding protein SmpB [Chitinophagaceae bacterium]|nr:SsrA-binding protein SmpB [Chitinophagaceae bacterium]
MSQEFNNRQAFFNYFIEQKFEAGIVLLGTEVKSIREGKLSFNDAFCILEDNEVWLRGLYIAEYKLGTTNNHIAVHDRKLLLKRREISKLQAATKEKGLTIIPLKVFINDKNLVKVEIGVAKGKKLYDKRETIKKKDNDREMKRYLK